jgi:hypothetical protein
MNAKELLLAVMRGLPGRYVALVVTVDGVLAVHISDLAAAFAGDYRFDDGDEARPIEDVVAEIVAMYARELAARSIGVMTGTP